VSEVARVILVTGAGTGIGRGIAELLAAKGNRVVGLGRRLDRLPSGRGFQAIGCDVGDPAQVEAALRRVETGLGRLDGVVTAAGIMRSGEFEHLRQSDILEAVQTNLLGTIHVIRAAIPLLRASRGAVVTIGSTLSGRPIRGTSVYAATKGAIEALTRALAVELGPDLVRVNCVVPALVRSDIWLAAGMPKPDYDKLIDQRGATYPLGRIGEPQDIAELVEFLLSPRAAWLTGTCIPADGGNLVGSRTP
jgi:NAD(P)-dependent dehydrogenase (short-subunit alcohol dehydrogenase family)